MRIALIEDNDTLAKGIAYRLRDQGHAVDIIADGVTADGFLRVEGADIVILDINLPDRDGLTVLKDLRQRGDATPVLLLTARASTDDRVKGLDAGADDYLVKPFEMEELEARVRALARRRPDALRETEALGTLTFDHAARQLFGGETPLDLPRRELAVFECLLENRGRIVSKTVLLDRVYGVGSETEEKVIEVYISRLRKRLSGFGVAIRTARGLGYMLDEAGPA
ncbi:MAG: response regulator transcription factor [Pseudomonadota bacterium]